MTEAYTTEDFVRALKGATLTAYSTGTETYSTVPAASSKEHRSGLGEPAGTCEQTAGERMDAIPDGHQ